jgi:hypothetical protein
MRIQEESKRRQENRDSQVSEAEGRWDVGLGERLVQTIWNWLGREQTPRNEGQSDHSQNMRKAA